MAHMPEPCALLYQCHTYIRDGICLFTIVVVRKKMFRRYHTRRDRWEKGLRYYLQDFCVTCRVFGVLIWEIGLEVRSAISVDSFSLSAFLSSRCPEVAIARRYPCLFRESTDCGHRSMLLLLLQKYTFCKQGAEISLFMACRLKLRENYSKL